MSDVDMSDDETGVGGKAVEQSMTFSAMGVDAKGKRSAANLPVELEDSLPWYFRPSSAGVESGADVLPRVEKYRPNTLDDVAGHKDILATINKFVEANVCHPGSVVIEEQMLRHFLAITASTPLWTSRHRQDIDSVGTSKKNIWRKEHEADGVGVER